MRFLITMNMPSTSGNLVHHVTMDVEEAESCEAFCDMMNSEEFIMGRQWYRRKNYDDSIFWEDRGMTILNTSHIGKVQEFIDMEEKINDDAQANTGSMRRNNDPARGGVWTSRGKL